MIGGRARDETRVAFDQGGLLATSDPRRLDPERFPRQTAVARFLAQIGTPEGNREVDRGRPFAEAGADPSPLVRSGRRRSAPCGNGGSR